MLFQFKVLYALSLALFCSQAYSAAIPEAGSSMSSLEKRGDGVLKLGFSVKKVSQPPTEGNSHKRDDATVEVTLQNEKAYYVTDLYFGSNKQKILVDVDTGSSDLWVVDSEAGIQGDYGVYDHSSSSSYEYVASGFEVAYVDHSRSSGDWVKDDVSLSTDGPTISKLQFGDATSSTNTFGILGIGLMALEGASQEYTNFPQALADQGFINKNAYSVYLDTQDAETGSVLFGGVDNAKFEGSLTTLPLADDPGRLSVNLGSISVEGEDYSVNGAVNLDTGTTLTYLPSRAVSQLAQQVGAQRGSDHYYWDSCDSAPDSATFKFDGVDIKVPKKDLGYPITDTNGNYIHCALSILPDSSSLGYLLLGDNFLRNAYLKYDLEDKTIGLAQVKYTTDEDISPIT